MKQSFILRSVSFHRTHPSPPSHNTRLPALNKNYTKQQNPKSNPYQFRKQTSLNNYPVTNHRFPCSLYSPTLGFGGTLLMPLCPQMVKAAFTLSRKDLDKVPDETELHPSLSFVPPNPPIATTQYPTAILKHQFNQTTKPINKPLLF